MSRRINRRKREKIVVIIMITVAIIATIMLVNVIDDIRVDNFVNNAEIVEISAGEGHGVKHYEGQFRPDFMSIDEYHQLIEDLNDLPQSGEIYSGQVIKFYK